jgi:hypothetical protein
MKNGNFRGFKWLKSKLNSDHRDWFQIGAFTVSVRDTWQNAARYLSRQPGVNQFDVFPQKIRKLKEKQRLPL